MKQPLNEQFRRMQKLAGISINENSESLLNKAEDIFKNVDKVLKKHR